jgi:7-cyano-7-deazaguanine tRNA-ribosyltransferase
MQFYVSWSHSDPLYQEYDKHCNMLISTTAVSSIWKLSRFPVLPNRIMIDSGSYNYISNQLPLPPPKTIFKRQLAIIAQSDIPTTICAVDMPILSKLLSLTEKNRAIDRTIANAWELKTLLAEYSNSDRIDKHKQHKIEPLAIVQGYDLPSLRYCARQLSEIGHTRFGLGSMAHLYNTKEIVKRVEAVQSVVGNAIHIFGVSAIETMKSLRALGIASVDSARPIKAAMYNEILYSDPYRRFGIAGSNFKSREAKFSPQKLLTELFIQCPCPVCLHSVKNDILRLGTRKYLLLRAVHNYYHIKKMISGWSDDDSENLYAGFSPHVV